MERRRSVMEVRSKAEPRLGRAQSTDNLDTAGERAAHASSIKGRNNKRSSIVKGHFPKLAECAHFHYEYVDFRNVQLSLAPQEVDVSWDGTTAKDPVFLIQVMCQGKSWLVPRSYEECQALDSHLHRCIYDRRFSQLRLLPPLHQLLDNTQMIMPLLAEYLARLSSIADNKINCGPVLTWMEIDNKGNRLLVAEEASINVPAIAAAQVIKRYTAQASDEISFEVGDIVSVIDMPPEEDTTWWRGKQGFQVGFFPSECVQVINERPSQPNTATAIATGTATASKPDSERVGARPAVNVHPSISSPSPTSVSRKHGKLMGFLRTFMKSRPSRQKLKQRGILRERVFGADLGEYLLDSGLDVPQVLRSCSEFIEKYGIVDGIYRLSGISSNIQKLRHEFDSDQVPDLTREVYMQDIHCVSSLCKLYFRELPNPLLTYQLYDRFAEAVCAGTEEERLIKVHNVIQQLPPPNYRTLEYLVRHLSVLAAQSAHTNMHTKNLAIVWAPNLLRSKEIELVGFSGAAAFREVRVQSVVVEFLLSNVDVLFSDSFSSAGKDTTGWGSGPPRASRKLLPRPNDARRLLTIGEALALAQLCREPGEETEPGEGSAQPEEEMAEDVEPREDTTGRLEGETTAALDVWPEE
uniref:Rho GTPase-activating protein 32-like protein n=1 Tax=Callorhinchus milii TaxID=7868 RepID=V9KL68_CALMI